MASFKSVGTQVFKKVLSVSLWCALAYSSMAGQAQPQLPQANDATDAASEDCDLGKAINDQAAAYNAAIEGNQQLSQVDSLENQAANDEFQAHLDRQNAAHEGEKAAASARWKTIYQTEHYDDLAAKAGNEGDKNKAEQDRLLKSAQAHEANASRLRKQAKETRQTAPAAIDAADAAYFAARSRVYKIMKLLDCKWHQQWLQDKQRAEQQEKQQQQVQPKQAEQEEEHEEEQQQEGQLQQEQPQQQPTQEAADTTDDVPVPSYLTVLTIHSDSGPDETTTIYTNPLTAYPIYDPETGKLRGRGVPDKHPGEGGWWGTDPKTGKLNWHRQQDRPPTSTLPNHTPLQGTTGGKSEGGSPTGSSSYSRTDTSIRNTPYNPGLQSGDSRLTKLPATSGNVTSGGDVNSIGGGTTVEKTRTQTSNQPVSSDNTRSQSNTNAKSEEGSLTNRASYSRTSTTGTSISERSTSDGNNVPSKITTGSPREGIDSSAVSTLKKPVQKTVASRLSKLTSTFGKRMAIRPGR